MLFPSKFDFPFGRVNYRKTVCVLNSNFHSPQKSAHVDVMSTVQLTAHQALHAWALYAPNTPPFGLRRRRVKSVKDILSLTDGSY